MDLSPVLLENRPSRLASLLDVLRIYKNQGLVMVAPMLHMPAAVAMALFLFSFASVSVASSKIQV